MNRNYQIIPLLLLLFIANLLAQSSSPPTTPSSSEEESSTPPSSIATSRPPPSNSTCGPNEVPTPCAPCDGTCANPNRICPLICIQRNTTQCRCRNEYVREQGRCIPERSCPSKRCCSFYYCIRCPASTRCGHSPHFPYRPHCLPNEGGKNCGFVPCRPGQRCVHFGGTAYCVPAFPPPFFFPPGK